MRSGASPTLAFVAKLVAVDAGEYVDDRFATRFGDVLCDIVQRGRRVMARFDWRAQGDVLDLAAELGQLVALQLAKLVADVALSRS